MSTAKDKLAENVRLLRNRYGWVQNDLAEAAGMDRPRISEIENGRSNPSLHVLDALAEAFGVPPWSLLK